MIGLLVDVPTDPFMMLVASYDHCDNHSGFATANFFVEDSRRSVCHSYRLLTLSDKYR